MLISAKSVCIYKCHEVDVARVKLLRNETSIYPLMKIRVSDGYKLFHVHRKVFKNHLPRAGSRKCIHKLGFKCQPVGKNNVVGLQVALNAKFQVCVV